MMTLSLAKPRAVHFRLIGRSLLAVCGESSIQMSALESVFIREFASSHDDELVMNPFISRCRRSSSVRWLSIPLLPDRIRREESSRDILSRKLETALRNHQVEEAWQVFNDFRKLYGLPDRLSVNRLFMELSYASDSRWTQKACDLVDIVNPHFIQPAVLSQLSISLARAQMPVPASKMLRLMLERETVPLVNVLALIILHMVKTDDGTHLASNVLIEICDRFLCEGENKLKSAMIAKPDVLIFNLVLDGCVRFNSPFKGQQLIELMAKVGVVADAQTVVIIAQIHHMNNQRDELNKFKEHIDSLMGTMARHYWRYYDRLLSLHFKFDDLDAASQLMLKLSAFKDNQPRQMCKKELHKPCLVQIGSQNLGTGLKLQVTPELLQKDSVLKLEYNQGLLAYRQGRLVLSNRTVAKLLSAYKRSGKIREVSKLVTKIQTEISSSGEPKFCNDVIDACIHLGWLETAHDILDDMELAGMLMDIGACRLLLSAYSRQRMFKEAKTLLKQMKKAGFVLDTSDEVLVSTCISEQSESNVHEKASNSGLAKSLVWEMKEEDSPAMTYKLDSSIYFFCKAKMIEDAMRTYQRMLQYNLQPSVQTFSSLAQGYSSLEMYRDMTILWGDIRRQIASSDLTVSRDLFEFFLLNFLKGGYFERVMDTIRCLRERNMFIDKQMCRNEFLKFHKHLYWNLKAPRAKTDAQLKRLEFVQDFRKWAGIR